MVLFSELLRDGFSQIHVSWNRRILRIVLVNSLLSGFLDMVRSHKVGLADAHVDNVDTLCFHLIALLRHCERCRRSKPIETV